jgi:hypothetical protein
MLAGPQLQRWPQRLERSTSVSSSQPTIPIIIDWRTNPRVPAAGKVIVIEDATPTSLVYRIE